MDVSTSLKRGACLSSVKPLFCLCFHSDRASRRFLNTSRLQLLCERSASARTCNANCDCCVVTIKMQMSGAELIMSTNQRLTMPILQPINTLHFYLLSRMFYRPIIRLLKRPHAKEHVCWQHYHRSSEFCCRARESYGQFCLVALYC